MTSHPRTIASLSRELAAGADDAAAAAAGFAEFARRHGPAPRKLSARKVYPSGLLPARTFEPGSADPPAGVMQAGRAAKLLSDALAAAPAVLAALLPLTIEPFPTAAALYVPDDHDPRVIRDAGTGQVHSDPDAGIVPWWPALPPAAVGTDLTLMDIEPDALILSGRCEHVAGSVARSVSTPWGDLIACANTLQLFRDRAAGWDQLARKTRGGGSQSRRAWRQAIRRTANRYQELVGVLVPLGDVLAAQYGAYIHTLTDGLTVLSATEGLTMPTVVNSPAVVSSLATRIRDAITTGHGGRLQVSDAEQAFSWTPGPAVTLLSYLATDTVDGRRATVVRASDSATPIAPIAEGGLKPDVVEFSDEDVALQKFAGQATITTEASQFVRNLETAVAAVMTGQLVRAIEANASAAMTADAGEAITGTDITAGVLSAIAAIRGNGGSPNVLALSAADWLALMTETGAAGGYINVSDVEAGPGPLWMGLAPVIVPGLVAGSALVADGRSVLVQEPKGGPLCLVDCLSQAKNNKIVITIESFAVTTVGSPGGVATVTVTP